MSMVTRLRGVWLACLVGAVVWAAGATISAQAAQVPAAQAPAPHVGGSEANLVLPELSLVSFLGVNGRTLLLGGLGIYSIGLVFGLRISTQLNILPVHQSML